ncbi:uncharacterized protein LOC143564586 [Bidens hawaiensis]|uniref:uncharacterized protein LOC143564586 n=1 Tax=Bidens hawaiensis TaxID=980011 RepID=UPI004048F166
MQKTLEDHNTNKPTKDPVISKRVQEGNNANPILSTAGQDQKPVALKSTNDTDSEHGHNTRVIRKCASVGTGLAAYQDVTSGEDSYSSHGNRSGDEYHNARASVSPQLSSNLVHNTSDMSPDRLSGTCKPCIPHAFVKSSSLPHMHLTNTNEVDKPVDNDSVDHADKSDGDGDEAYDYAGTAKDWIVPGDEPGKGKTVHEEYSGSQWEEMPTEDFKIRRVEKWVMDLQHSSSLDEADTLTDLDHQGQNGKSKNNILDSIPASKTDAKSVLGMDAAKRYISSLNPAATTAQLVNHGLVVVPFLSGFVSLRALNLSGNSIGLNMFLLILIVNI